MGEEQTIEHPTRSQSEELLDLLLSKVVLAAYGLELISVLPTKDELNTLFAASIDRIWASFEAFAAAQEAAKPTEATIITE